MTYGGASEAERLRDIVPVQPPRNPDPYYFAAMLDDELRRVQEGVATPATISRARDTYADGIARIAAGEYAGHRWSGR